MQTGNNCGFPLPVCDCVQDHGTILPMLLSGRTAQPSALTPLAIINDCLDQLEKLAAANLKGGVFQGEQAVQGTAAAQEQSV